MTLTLGVQYQVVFINSRGVLSSPLGVEAGWRDLRGLLVLDVVVEVTDGGVTEVQKFKVSAIGVRHGPVAVKSAAGHALHQRRVVPILCEAAAEHVPERHLDTGVVLVVPCILKNRVSKQERIPVPDGEPGTVDNPCTFQVGESRCLPGIY